MTDGMFSSHHPFRLLSPPSFLSFTHYYYMGSHQFAGSSTILISLPMQLRSSLPSFSSSPFLLMFFCFLSTSSPISTLSLVPSPLGFITPFTEEDYRPTTDGRLIPPPPNTSARSIPITTRWTKTNVFLDRKTRGVSLRIE